FHQAAHGIDAEAQGAELALRHRGGRKSRSCRGSERSLDDGTSRHRHPGMVAPVLIQIKPAPPRASDQVIDRGRHPRFVARDYEVRSPEDDVWMLAVRNAAHRGRRTTPGVLASSPVRTP